MLTLTVTAYTDNLNTFEDKDNIDTNIIIHFRRCWLEENQENLLFDFCELNCKNDIDIYSVVGIFSCEAAALHSRI